MACMRSALLGVLLLLVAACSSEPHWVGDDVHVVDGFWLQRETPCPFESVGECQVAVEAALAGSGLAGPDVGEVATADWPMSYVDGTGGTILGTTSGISRSSAVIVDLPDGSREVVGVLCSGPISTNDGTLVSPRTCDYYQELAELKRVGNEPWLGGS
jgi:hypothetical protein